MGRKGNMMKKIVLVSGGTDGLGRAVADRLRSDHTVVIMSATGPKCLKTARELDCDSAVGDVSNYAACERAVAQVIERHGRLDVLINNAGIWLEGPLETLEPEAIHRTFEVNALGTINLTRAALPQMKQQGNGRIINVISSAGKSGKPGKSVYAASKFAITGFTEALQSELAPAGIGVTGVYPGKLNTQFFAKTGIQKSMDNALDPDVVSGLIAQVVEAGPTTQISDLTLGHIGS
jgi:NAD(P)-dependent dehydrogenase (short-subunit alcohol dehydrogenase family)